MLSLQDLTSRTWNVFRLRWWATNNDKMSIRAEKVTLKTSNDSWVTKTHIKHNYLYNLTVILPTSALEHLTRLHIEYPMLFKIVNKSKNRTTHCGVLEFIAEEGRCYLPFWMMRNLIVTEGEIIQVEYVKLSVAQFAKFQPQSVDFLEITNPKAV